MGLSEFDLINRYFGRGGALKPSRPDVELGIGDDAAVVNVPAGQSLVMSLDTLVAGIHFPDHTSAEDIAYKALAVNLSDMAAMAAEPGWFMLGLTLPQADEAWLAGFSAGLSQLANQYDLALIGGDTTHGSLTVSIQINGLVPHGQALKRRGAQPGDLIYVSGQLGDAGLGLQLALAGLDIDLTAQRQQYFLQRLNRPTPRLELGLALRGLATAAIDVSDGLLADLGHILKASGVGASINLEQLPVADEVRGLSESWWSMPLTAGDDYELCFTVPAARRLAFEGKIQGLECPCSCIGKIETESGLNLLLDGCRIDSENLKGYLHFD
ncbi:MAG TPA: thiamine-phosphate kinase [Candidatus Tenderia electrophaga]|uniref:Thiamine-monophosphate kinase n=1 Tax=Candidatus Tenderia electrophaga TaxID=1748243 RepID=A0A832N3F9_9GAMM|nr:thiamine-phosphate kinase [Candidatus Tenderia electrophaga]